METISKLFNLDIIKGLPKISFIKEKICKVCIKEKQVKSNFHSTIFTNKPLKLPHIDLFCCIKTTIISGKKYGL